MKYQGGTVDEAAVKAAGGAVVENGNGVRVGGWVITSHKGPITADAELEALKQQLGTLAAPEQFYGENHLRLHHEPSGATLSFNALDALKGWLADTSEPVLVGEAEEWLAARQQDVAAHAAQTVDYDWTYTTSYNGSLEQAGSGSSAGGADGTAAAAGPAAGAAGGADGPAAAAWEATSEQIDRALLTSRDPILYYDELPLYESELDDHGSSKVLLKVRVMPRCWYVLLRFWLRVDHVMVRLRETRVFCRFDAPPAAAARLLREVRHHEGTFAALRAAGAPAEGPAYSDPDTAAAALMAVAPVGVSHYRMERLSL
ncbi:TIP41 isoform X1 [Micractinium conductrix]|uniref:TIP41 isoform X1 n=1 Tax=Micractinium conductrix TaxID=554055 RepID=A0A2P6VFZ9_9CHLO|nr:TIP41 isoform X1 [Micractinium conductrix]|eukprot:PSC73022.1 TIP41 isoform X1 [Micractinium conductrix]